jgi:glycosyltransferase involved in cell wall biosynthesis
MRLLIISNMPHHIRSDGRTVGWGPTVQEIDHLATRFDEVRHVATLHEGEPPASYLPYAGDRVALVPMTPRGGDRLVDKLGVLSAAPTYVGVMLRELQRADVVHLRCPANLPMIGATLLPFVRAPAARWIKYGGNWRPERDSIAFAFQRWLLARDWHRGVVTINGTWPGQPSHVRSFYNPSLTDDELHTARTLAATKQLTSPLRLLFVGSLLPAKGGRLAIETLAALHARGIVATLDVVGDGPDRAACEASARTLSIEDRVTFHGWVPRPALGAHYTAAHVMLFPSKTEGWPKVLSEGMAYGVVPVATAVGAIAQYLDQFACGRAIARPDPLQFANAIATYVEDPESWRIESQRGLIAATRFSYSSYLHQIDKLLAEISAPSHLRARTI